MNDKKIELALLKIISEMVECPAGSFMMGSPKDELGRNIYGEGNDFETRHKVAITKPFWIGKFLITREQYETIMEEEPMLILLLAVPKTSVPALDVKLTPEIL